MAKDSYKEGYKIGKDIAEKASANGTRFLEAIEKISKKSGEIEWDNGNPFTTDFKDIYDRYSEYKAELVKKGVKKFEASADKAEFEKGMAAGGAAAENKLPDIDFEVVAKRLEANFYRNQASNPKFHENTQIPAGVKTEEALFQHLLRNNRGVALGDEHTQDESLKLLTKNMKMFKREGVDTIYMECEPEILASLNSLSIKEMVDDANKAKPDDGLVDMYGQTSCDNVVKEFLLMLAEAKRVGVEVKTCEDRLLPLEDQIKLSVDLRIAATNYEWAHNIEKDREGKDGKFIVWGGVLHFAHSKMNTNGYVDDALGIPHIAYAISDKKDGKFTRGNGDADGVDFYLHGGKNYFGTYHGGASLKISPEMMEQPPKAIPVDEDSISAKDIPDARNNSGKDKPDFSAARK